MADVPRLRLTLAGKPAVSLTPLGRGLKDAAHRGARDELSYG
jgi:hypothetical protein